MADLTIYEQVATQAGPQVIATVLHDNGNGTYSRQASTTVTGMPASLGQKAKVASLPVVLASDQDALALAAGEAHIGQVGGHIAVPTATFARPNTTPTYASGQLVANSATAGSVAPLTLTVARVAAGTLMIRRVRLKKSSTGLTGASFRVHFYKATAPTPSNGDTGAWLTDQAANYLGAFDVTMDKAFTDGAHGSGTPNTGSEVSVALASGTDIYALVEARGAYVGVANETFLLAAEVLQN